MKKSMYLEQAKFFHKLWMNECDPEKRKEFWDWHYDALKRCFDNDHQKMSYINDLILVKHLDQKFGGSHLKDICKNHCRDYMKEMR